MAAVPRGWQTPRGSPSGSTATPSTWSCCWATRRRDSAAREVGDQARAHTWQAVAPPLVGTQIHEYIPTLLSPHQHLQKTPSCSHMQRPYMTLMCVCCPPRTRTRAHARMNPQTPHHPPLRLQRRGLGQLWGVLCDPSALMWAFLASSGRGSPVYSG